MNKCAAVLLQIILIKFRKKELSDDHFHFTNENFHSTALELENEVSLECSIFNYHILQNINENIRFPNWLVSTL